MTFKDMRLPVSSLDGVGGPGFSTTIVRVDSGHEPYVNQNWPTALQRYEANFHAGTREEWMAWISFFYNAAGMANSWRLEDPLDFDATASEGVFVAIDSTHFQMHKRYVSGSYTYLRKITKPRSPAVITGGAGVSVDYTTGIVTVSSGTPTAWAGEFDVHCRFDTDDMRYTILDKNLEEGFIVAWTGIPIVEVRD